MTRAEEKLAHDKARYAENPTRGCALWIEIWEEIVAEEQLTGRDILGDETAKLEHALSID